MDYQDLELLKWEDDGGSIPHIVPSATANKKVISLPDYSPPETTTFTKRTEAPDLTEYHTTSLGVR
jgi:hypothetical protein